MAVTPVIQAQLPSLGNPQVSSAGLWRTDNGFVSTIQIKNANVTESITVTPILYMSDGQEYDLAPVHLDQAAVATVNINEQIGRLPDHATGHLSGYGSAALRFAGFAKGVLATMVMKNDSASLSYVTPFAPSAQGPTASQVLEGLWWRHDTSVGGFVGLSNSTAAPVQVLINAVSANGSTMPVEVYTLPPYATKMIDLTSWTSGFVGGEDRQGGLRIQYSGHLGDVNIVGGLESDDEGYSAMMPFWMASMGNPSSGTAAAQPVTLSHVGIMVGSPDPMMSFPENTHFSPYLALRNTTAKPVDIQLTLYPENRQASKVQVERLQPNESKQVDMKQVMASAGLKDFNGNVTLATSHSGQLTDVIEAAGSVDTTGTYVFEVEGKAVEQSLSKQTPYWSTVNGNDTMVSLWNGSAIAEDIVVTLYFQGGAGQYQLPFHLGAYGSPSFSIGQLIMEQKPDAKGNVIPAGTTVGSISYASAQGITKPMTLNVNVGVFNVSTATCFYGCVSCDGYSGLAVVPNPLYCPFGDSHQMGAQGTYDNGNTYGVGASWSSDNSSVANVNSSGIMTGDGIGGATLTAQAVLPSYGQVCAYNPSCSSQPYQTFQGQGTVTVQPTVTIQVQNYFTDMVGGIVLIGGPGGVTSTAISGNGNPGGGAYTWSAGPNLQISGINSQSASATGTASSSSRGDTYISLTYGLNGETANASYRFTVLNPTTFQATSTGGSEHTQPVNQSAGSGYITTITYYAHSQLGAPNEIQVPGIPFTEVLTTISNPYNAIFDPPDNTARTQQSSLNGDMSDNLSAVIPGGIPPGFSASRSQNFTVNGFSFNPAQQQSYSSSSATIATTTLTR